MTYQEFCAAVTATLAQKPAFTGLRFGTGHLMHDKTGALVALAEGEPLDDAFEVDSSHWEDGVLEGMTPESIALALAKPDFCQFNQEIILLHAEDGCLQFEKGIVWRLYYGSSDYDTIAWPAPDMHNLRTALTTLRETSNLVSSGCEFAKLPDGAIVAF